jgi:hypothetical protein
MIEVLGKCYYIDIEAVIEKCRPEHPFTKSKEKVTNDKVSNNDEGILELNVFKFEIFKACIERILSEYEEKDDDIPPFQAKSMGVSFRLAFNTLLKYNIIIEDIEDIDG